MSIISEPHRDNYNPNSNPNTNCNPTKLLTLLNCIKPYEA